MKIDPDKVVAVGKLESEFVVISLLLLFPLNRFFHSFVYLLVFYFYFSSLLVCSL